MMQKFLNPVPATVVSDKEDAENTGAESAQPNPTATRLHKWTHIHSFYALMGGFAFSTADLPEDQKFLPGSRDRVVLRERGILAVAEFEPSLLPDMSAEDIMDKSKAAGFDKTIVCMQATWFIAQTTLRLAEKLPISLLELNTAIHAICALLIYILWWDKPLNVTRPTLITGPSMHTTCATLCYSSSLDREWIKLKPIEHGIEPSPTVFLRHDRKFDPDATPDCNLRPHSHSPGKLYVGESIAGFTLDRFYLQDYRILSRRRAFIEYQPKDVRLLTLAYQGLSGLGRERRLDLFNSVGDRIVNWPSTAGFGFNRLVDIKIDSYTYGPEWRPFVIALISASLIYGGLHLLAWDAPFVSHKQTILWKTSALAIVASGPVILMLHAHGTLLLKCCEPVRQVHSQRSFYFWVRYLILPLFIHLQYLLAFTLPLLYVFARVYLVVECFISLSYLPRAVFIQPQWTSYYPHIT
jgi:hypothetical protein